MTTSVSPVPASAIQEPEHGLLSAALAGSPDALAELRAALGGVATDQAEAFRAGEPVENLVTARAAHIDALLRGLWRASGFSHEPIALLAVGGYGRGELHPHSDVDLLILLEGAERERLAERIEVLLRLLWDVGLKPGSSVRSMPECVSEAEREVTVATNLMEARLLAGPRSMFDDLMALTGPARLWPGPAFFEAKMAEQQRRHRRFHDTAYNLEPNLKEGPGGLRDLANIGWVAKRHFGVADLRELISHGFLHQDEYAELMHCQGFLWRVRFALHQLTGRAEERLLFDYQRPLAGLLGYGEEDQRAAVEALMLDYYRTICALARLNELLLQLFREELLLGGGGAVEPIENFPRFHRHDGYVEAADPAVFRRQPLALLEVYLLLAEHPELRGIRASTIRLIRTHRHLIDDHFRADLKARTLFLELLRQPRGVYHELRRMHRHGVLAAYLPAFGRIVGRMQFDLFHAYTVDEHTLFVVRNLRRLSDPEARHELPLASEIKARLPKPELLYIAGLFHDIAKGRGGDHSELGADEAELFCLNHHLPTWDTQLVVWLVRNHLILSGTAQRQDVADPEVINDFAARVGDRVRLDYLYLLTVADIRATNPELWNAWKASLLAELYTNTRRALRRGLEHPLDREERIHGVREAARRLLHREGLDDAAIDALWREHDDAYFLRHSADEVVWHGTAIAKARPADLPLVRLRPEHGRGGTALFVYARDEDGLFAITTAVLDQLGLSVHDARIIDLPSGHTLNTYIVLDEEGRPLEEGYRSDELAETLRRRILSRSTPEETLNRRLPRRHKHIPEQTRVYFSPDPCAPRTVMELFTLDRPGLLSRIGQVFLEQRVRLHNAKIATIGHRAEDVFYITGLDNRPLQEAERLERLKAALQRALEGSGNG